MHTLFQGVTVLTAVAALLFTARSLDYTADATGATREQLRLSEQGQISDRFSKAVDQLGQEGDDKLSVRLGGIYALERVMRDSADEPTVIEVLCAFTRTHAPRPIILSAFPVDPSSPDVQAAVTVLARRPNPHLSRNQRLDLSGTLLGLPNAALRRAHLARAYLGSANLTDADLVDAGLTGAELGNANLDYADLTGADLTDASLHRADLTGADLADADLTGADLTGAYLARAHLADASLTGAQLTGADQTGVIGLTAEQLAGAQLDARTRLPDRVDGPSPFPTR
jgi:hypothetical protein